MVSISRNMEAIIQPDTVNFRNENNNNNNNHENSAPMSSTAHNETPRKTKRVDR